MIFLGKKSTTLEEARLIAEKHLVDGSAYKKFKDVVAAQGGNPQALDNFALLPNATGARDDQRLCARAQTPASERFDDLSRRAQAALDSHPEEAIQLYRQALGIRPDWPEGWLYTRADLIAVQRECPRGVIR